MAKNDCEVEGLGRAGCLLAVEQARGHVITLIMI